MKPQSRSHCKCSLECSAQGTHRCCGDTLASIMLTPSLRNAVLRPLLAASSSTSSLVSGDFFVTRQMPPKCRRGWYSKQRLRRRRLRGILILLQPTRQAKIKQILLLLSTNVILISRLRTCIDPCVRKMLLLSTGLWTNFE